MNLKKVQAFVLVVQKGSFTEAADLLGLTQPAVSNQIKGLENELGVRLLERASTNVEITSAGRFVYDLGIELLEKWEELDRGIQYFQHTLVGSIRVGTSTIPGTYLLPRWIGGFHKQFPQVTIENEVSDSHEIQTRLFNRKIDVAITGAVIESPLATSEPVAMDSLVLIAPIDHPEFHGLFQVALHDTVAYPFVLREEGSGQRRSMEAALIKSGVDLESLRVVAHFGSTEAVVAAVESGLGISFVSRLAALQAARARRVEIVSSYDNFQHTYYLSHLNAYSNVPRVRQFIDFIRSVSSNWKLD